MILYEDGGQSEIIDDNDGKLRRRGCTDLDQTKAIKHGFAVKYLK